MMPGLVVGGPDAQPDPHRDRQWMLEALGQARLARDAGEVPVGAVLVVDGEVVGRGFNETIGSTDPTAHAEIVALRTGASRLGNYRTGGVLYVTLEPCLMCMGAMVQARVDRLVYGADDPKAGAASSLYAIADDERLNHGFDVSSGVLADEAAELLRDFFKERRRG